MEYNSREEFMVAVQAFIGDRQGEDVIAFLKDVEDNTNFAEHQELVTKVKEWEDKYTNLLNDYQSRFFTGGERGQSNAEPAPQPPQEEVVIEPTEETITIDDLFEEKEE